jgi:flagellar hook-associated protein 3 FlgL
MTMRVASLMNNTKTMMDLQRLKQSYSQTSQQLSSGKQINNIGDDPSRTSQIMDYQSSIDLNSNYLTQLDTATSQLQGASTVVATIGTDIARLLELGQEGLGNDTAVAGGPEAIAPEVDAIRTAFINLGNTQVAGRYLFGGSNTTEVPFDDDGSYHGNNKVVELDVSPSASVITNIPGDTLFFGGAGKQGTDSDLIAQTQNMATALKNNDQVLLKTTYDNLQSISATINSHAAELGGRENGILALKSGLNDFNSNLTTIQSSLASTDYPAAISKLNQDSVSQQASLNTMARSNSKSLFDYMA